eukprot:GHVU01135617.1.p2 GENE.GHVU01135617.1~~GHVU01135617.1.p2  ORF type:complete len:115 (+),score=6.99 GHVU01135617.1:675-1019(+)
MGNALASPPVVSASLRILACYHRLGDLFAFLLDASAPAPVREIRAPTLLSLPPAKSTGTSDWYSLADDDEDWLQHLARARLVLSPEVSEAGTDDGCSSLSPHPADTVGSSSDSQ